MLLPKVFLAGGDGMGWALDEDLNLTRRALEGIVEFTDLEHCEVVHSVWWEELLRLPKELLVGKRIICHFSNRPFHYLKQPRFRLARELAGYWIAQASEAQRELASIGINSELIPYTTDTNTFRPLPSHDSDLREFGRQWNILGDHYLIGNFHRDTEGRDLCSPKVQKGPDIFAEIVRGVVSKGYRVHVLLAGPRRFWIRRRLSELGVPFTFIGQIVENTDDFPSNVLDRSTVNKLYNLLDLYLITSRWEGGPRSVLEACAARCKVISTHVGLAEDVLESGCIYVSPLEAVNIIERDIQTNWLEATIEPQFRRVMQNHQPAAVAPHFRRLYKDLEQVPVYVRDDKKSTHMRKHSPLRFTIRVLKSLTGRSPDGALTVGLWHRFFKPPYGGGNQFMLALRKALWQRGVRVVENCVSSLCDAHIINSVHFDVGLFRQSQRRRKLKIVHRIDGPIHLYRGSSPDLDYLCFELNAEFANATVLQSAWTYQRIVEMGYQPVSPVIIHNAVDPDIFHQQGRISFDSERKIRLISTSWSDNPRKGGPTYKWIEEHLDWSRFEYTFVGNTSERFDRIRHIPPVPSEQLADILRQHDIYITASQNDPCSNALIEALACGLPALYLNDGGHPELVGYGGLPFNDVDEILPQLDALVENYEMFQNLIVVPSLDDVADKYLALLKEVAES